MPREIDIQELLEGGLSDEHPSRIRTTTHKIHSHHYFLDEEIGEPAQYRDLIQLLYMGSEDDQTNIFINSPGGHLSSAMAIIQSIHGCDGMVRAILNGECHSAASMIALNCPEIVVTDAAHMMVHTAQFGTGGSTQNVKYHADFSTIFINNIIDKTYYGFMTPDEIIEVKKGVEFWFDADQIRARLTKRLEIMKADKAKAEKKKRPPRTTK